MYISFTKNLALLLFTLKRNLFELLSERLRFDKFSFKEILFLPFYFLDNSNGSSYWLQSYIH